MAIIHCPECDKEVSDKAQMCPHCAYPVVKQVVSENVQIIELTSKKLKSQLILAALVTCIGFFFCFMAILNETESSGLLLWGILFLLVGVTWMVIVKLKIWWNHE